MKTVVITGASSGIGEASARLFAKEGWRVIAGARRLDRLQRLADETGAQVYPLDITDEASVAAFVKQIDSVETLINNAGGAFGLEPVAEADLAQWQKMYDVNVLGTARITQALLPKLIESSDGHVINICSIAAHFTYEGGAGYTGVKHAEHALNDTLRKELMGQPVRITEIDPGMVETEFSLVRFDGDKAKADEVYEGAIPLTAEDVAEAIVWSANRPTHVNIDSLLIAPRDQVVGHGVHRQK